MTSGIPRRTLAKGAAWAIPAVLTTSAAPALAASTPAPPPRLSMGGTTGWNKAFYASLDKCTTGAPVVLDGRGILGTSTQVWDGLWFIDTLPTDQICNVTFSVWYPMANATWTALAGVTGWSALTRSGATMSYGGVTYYEYKATYLNGGCFTASTLKTGYNGWRGIPYGWVTTNCYSTRPMNYFRLGSTATVRGLPLTYQSAWTQTL